MKSLNDLILSQSSKVNSKVIALEESLTAFSNITQIPVTFFSTSGKLLWATSQQIKICNANSEYPQTGSKCMQTLVSAMNISLNLGEVYTFKCNSDLINLCHALIIEKKLHGYLIAGPVAMGMKREKVLANFAKKTMSEQLDYPYLLTLIGDLKLCEPRQIAYITTLFYNSIRAPLEIQSSGNIHLQKQQEQNRISSKIIHIKKEHLELDYPYESENELVQSIRSGSSDTCHRRFSKYLEDIMVFEGGNLPIVKLRLISFLTQLLKNGESWQRDYSNLLLLDEINRSSTLKEIVELGGKLIGSLVRTVSANEYSGSSTIVRRAVTYIRTHYSEPLTLKQLSEDIHVSNTYLSVLFRKEMGISAIDYLNKIRLEHAEDMLHNASLSISDISMECGFSSQSYFARLFKNKYGMTPNAYRKKACSS